jgi:hypothetical protein
MYQRCECIGAWHGTTQHRARFLHVSHPWLGSNIQAHDAPNYNSISLLTLVFKHSQWLVFFTFVVVYSYFFVLFVGYFVCVGWAFV